MGKKRKFLEKIGFWDIEEVSSPGVFRAKTPSGESLLIRFSSTIEAKAGNTWEKLSHFVRWM